MALILVGVTMLNNAIEYRRETPWCPGTQPASVDFFKKTITGKVVVLGPPSWRPVPQKFLESSKPKGVTILSRCVTLPHTNAFYGKLKQGATKLALELSKNEDVYVVGGEQMYNLFIAHADEIRVARVRLMLWSGSNNSKHFSFFPEINRDEWELDHSYTYYTDGTPGTSNHWPTSFFRFTRKKK